MAINLRKGQSIDLRKSSVGEEYDLSRLTIGLGWDVRQKEKGFFGTFFGSQEEEYDLDAIAFLLDANGKVADLGHTASVNGRQLGLYEGDVIYFNSMKHPSGHIYLTGDNRTGQGDGDDEQIIVNLNALPSRYHSIVFLVNIYQGIQNKQHFGMVENAFIRAEDARGREIARFSISNDPNMHEKCSMIFAEAYREGATWKFKAVGDPYRTDNFLDHLKRYIYQQ